MSNKRTFNELEKDGLFPEITVKISSAKDPELYEHIKAEAASDKRSLNFVALELMRSALAKELSK